MPGIHQDHVHTGLPGREIELSCICAVLDDLRSTCRVDAAKLMPYVSACKGVWALGGVKGVVGEVDGMHLAALWQRLRDSQRRPSIEGADLKHSRGRAAGDKSSQETLFDDTDLPGVRPSNSRFQGH